MNETEKVNCRISEKKYLERFLESLRKFKQVSDKGIIYVNINKSEVKFVAKPEIES